MGERPNDSGESNANPLSLERIGAQIRRPAVWSLLLLIAVVLAVQIWLLFL